MIERDAATGLPIFRPGGETLRRFMSDQTSRVKIIQGPQGSGTSSACCVHLFQMALAQPPQADGKKRFRAHVFRETYGKLEETVIKTWLDWFKPGNGQGQFGIFYQTRPYRHEIRVGPLEMDVTFMAMDDIVDAKSYFDSLETSAIWFNEVQHAQFKVVTYAAARVSPPRYPAVKDGGCVWGGLIADTNAPPADHWIPIMRGDVPVPDWMSDAQRTALVKPDNWTFYLQPAGLIEIFDGSGALIGYKPNPAAENLDNLPGEALDPVKNFYMQKLGGQTKQWIDSYIMNRSAVVVDGKPVYPQFRRDVHVSDRPLKPIAGLPVGVGLDFGRQPAALIGQTLRGDWFIQREFIGRDMSAVEFAPLLKSYLAQQYPGYSFTFWGDPAGQQRGQATDKTPFEVFNECGMYVRPAPNPQNQRTVRYEAVNSVLMRRSTSGRPSCMLVDPSCSTYITGMSGGYYMRRVRVSGERYAEEPEKNQYCMPLDTEALLPAGWKRHDELREGEPIYCFDMTTRKIIIGKVERVNLFPGAKKVTTLAGEHCSITSTAEHQHVVRTRADICKLVRTADLNGGQSLVCAASEDRPRKQYPFSDEFISLAAWVMAEGSYRPDDEAIIVSQSRSHNPGYCEYLSRLLKAFPGTIQHDRPDDEQQTWYIRQETAWMLRQWMPGKIPSAAFIARMCNSNRRRFLYEFIRGDGHAGGNLPDPGALTRARDFCPKGITPRAFQKSHAAVDALQMMAVLCGLRTRVRPQEMGFLITFLAQRPLMSVSRKRVVENTIDGIWCPTTSHGTWICRQGGTTFITGNSHICEAGENLLLGGGEGKAVTMGNAPRAPVRIFKRNRDLRRITG